MATITVEVTDQEAIDWATYITEAVGQPIPTDIDDVVNVIIDGIQLDRKRLTTHILGRRALAITSQSIQAAVAAVTVLPVRKSVALVGGHPPMPILP
jgi:hypothetical protein